jgi:hypothetical protein
VRFSKATRVESAVRRSFNPAIARDPEARRQRELTRGRIT